MNVAYDTTASPPRADATANLPGPASDAIVDAELVARFRRIAQTCSRAVGAIGTVVLLGYATDSAILIRFGPTMEGMAPNTAVAFVLLGLSLHLQLPDAGTGAGWHQAVARVCAALTLLLGGATLAEYLFDWNLNIDQWLFADLAGSVKTAYPARMAAGTAGSFVLVGAALLLVDSPRAHARRLAQFISAPVFVFALAGLYGMGFGQGAAGVYQLMIYSGIAYHTLIAFLLLSASLVLAHIESGPQAIMAAPGVGGRLARRLLPVALMVPPVIGWLRLLGDRYSLYPNEVGVALVALTNMTIFSVALWFAARSLERLDHTRVAAEAALRQASRYNRSLIEASVDPLVTISPEGKLTDVNQATVKTVGIGRTQLIGTDFSDYFTEPDKAREGYRRVFREGQVRDFPLQIRAKDGRITPVLYNASVYHDDSGRMIGVFAAARDDSERGRSEQAIRELNASLERRVDERTAQLASANKDLEGFSYSVSHDLRAPLRAIDSFSKILLEDHAGQLDAEGQRLLATVRRNTETMSRLIDDILAFSRAGRSELQPSDVDVTALVREVLPELLPAPDTRRIDVRVGELPHAWADRGVLRQVLVNLLSNAVKFTTKCPAARIEVDGETTPAETVYSIRDNGAGFDPAYAHKLFGVFQRLHGADEFPGTGIGLAIVKRIIDKHGGRVWAEGQVGHGACFHFSLPHNRSEPGPGGPT